jgi:hypothetical protein
MGSFELSSRISSRGQSPARGGLKLAIWIFLLLAVESIQAKPSKAHIKNQVTTGERAKKKEKGWLWVVGQPTTFASGLAN